MRNENIIIMGRTAEKVAGDIRIIMTHYPDDARKQQVLRFAGALCSMASSLLCELYEAEGQEHFNMAHANKVLREWGVDELEA